MKQGAISRNLLIVSEGKDQMVIAQFEQVNGIPEYKTMTISVKGEWNIFLQTVSVKEFISNVPLVLDVTNYEILLDKFLLLKKCDGNTDFQELIDDCFKDSVSCVKDKSGCIVGEFESPDGCQLNDIKVVRSSICQKVVDNSNSAPYCLPCKELRKTLMHRMDKIKAKIGKPLHLNTRIDKMEKTELQARVKQLSKENKDLKRQSSVLEGRIQKLVKKKGVELDGDLKEVCDSVTTSESCPFPENSPLQFLWDQQKKCALSNQKGMRWHPLMIRWCMSIYLKSPGTHKHLRNSGFLKLPDRTTLNKYANFTEGKCGFNPDVLKLLVKEISGYSPYQKNVGVLFDEMKIKSNLVYNKATGKLVGFCELGQFSEELSAFTASLDDCDENQKPDRELSSNVLAFMVKGIFTNLAFPFGYFAGTGFTSNQLYGAVWPASRVLESIGLYVRFFCSDGASPNRSFYDIHCASDKSNVSDDGVVYWTWNKYSFPQRKIFFIIDVPHLMKTARNNFANSGAHSHSRNLVIDGTEVSWLHIVKLLEIDLCVADRHALGLYKTKLTPEHVYLTPRSKMSVSLAVQVFSKSVFDLLTLQNLDSTVQTRKFVFFMNNFFDCLNVRNEFEGKLSRNTDLIPYTSVHDSRLSWLKEDFLKFINSWQKDAKGRQELTKAERGKLTLSLKTIKGLRMSVHSIVDLIKELLDIDGVRFVLTDKFNQDSLEEHFYRQRSRGGDNENPDLHQYAYNELKLQITKSNFIRAMGNTKGRKYDDADFTIDSSSLPKRCKKDEKK